MLEGFLPRRERSREAARAQQLADEDFALESDLMRLRGSISAVAHMVGASEHDAPFAGDLAELLGLIEEKAERVATRALTMMRDRT